MNRLPLRVPVRLAATARQSTVEGRIGPFLVLVILNQTIYPITQWGLAWLVLYQLLYASMFVAGIYVASDSRRHVIVTATTAAIFLVVGLWYAQDTSETWRVAVTYLALIPYLGTVIRVLLHYIFLAREVTRDVLYAATSVYILLGALFVPIYGLLLWLQPGAIVDGAAPDAPMQWQQLIYYSYITLTTAGYGDVLPVSWWARSLASIETVIGVLYLAIMMARLVGLYAQEPTDEEAGA